MLEGIGEDWLGSPGGLVVSVASEVEQAALLGAAAYAEGKGPAAAPSREPEFPSEKQAQGIP